MTSIRTKSAYSLRHSIANLLEETSINSENKQYVDIASKQHINDFIHNVVIEQIYNEQAKQYGSQNQKHHYLNYYNFFMGMRVTQNRAVLTKNQNFKSNGNQSNVRQINYSGDTKTKYSKIDTSTFGSDTIAYWSSWGYAGVGGFVHYFNSLLTLNQARSKFSSMVSDGLFSSELLDITIELMFYNENYQTGIVHAYQFLINNSGDIEKYEDTNAFYLTRYSQFYHQSSESMRRFLILLDILYFIVFIVFIGNTLLMTKSRIMDLVNYKSLSIMWYDILDFLVFIISIVNLGFWISINWEYDIFKISFTSESHFDNYVKLSENTKAFWIISAILFFFTINQSF